MARRKANKARTPSVSPSQNEIPPGLATTGKAPSRDSSDPEENELIRRLVEDSRSATFAQPDRPSHTQYTPPLSPAPSKAIPDATVEHLVGNSIYAPDNGTARASEASTPNQPPDEQALAEVVFVPPAGKPQPLHPFRGPEPPYETTLPPMNGGAATGSAETPPTIPDDLKEVPEEERRQWLSRIGKERLRALNQKLSTLYGQAVDQLSNQKELLAQVMSQLREARAILVERPEYYAEAEYRVQNVEAVLMRVQRSREWGARYGPRLLLYEIAWLALLLGAFVITSIFSNQLTSWLTWVSGQDASSALVNQALPFLSTLLWGGIGGVVSALWSLHWHISSQLDFDRDYILWYLEQPLLGIVLGGIIYLIMGTGFLALQTNLASEPANLGARMLPSTIAFVGGFRQNLVYSLIDRIVQLIIPQPQ